MRYHQSARSLAGVLLSVVILSGCGLMPQTRALKEQPPSGVAPRKELSSVPYFPEDKFQCGPQSLAMVINAVGVKTTPDVLKQQVYLPEKKGSLQVEMLAATRRHGLVAYELAPKLSDVIVEVANDNPVVVLQNLVPGFIPAWHYAVVIGYDLNTSEFILRSGRHERQTMPISLFEYMWKDGKYWAMVALPSDRLPATATQAGYGKAAAALEKSGNLQAARTAYNTLLKRWPEDLLGQIGLGNVSYASGDLRQAEAAFRKATQVHPDSAAAFNNLAQTLADQKKYPEALVAAKQAVKLGGPLLPASQETLKTIENKSRVRSSSK